MDMLDFRGLDWGMLATLCLVFGGCLLVWQRTERKRQWLSALILVFPAGYALGYWANARGNPEEAILAGVIAILLNVLFWLAYGRRHPPGSSDDIQVVQ